MIEASVIQTGAHTIVKNEKQKYERTYNKFPIKITNKNYVAEVNLIVVVLVIVT